jgi:HK97 family phage portal protein
MTFVVTAGQLAAITQPVRPAALPVYNTQISTTTYQSYEQIWRTQPNVRKVVGFLARNIAQLGLHVFRRLSDVDRVRLTDHPLAQLIGRPLPPEFKTTRYRLINSLVQDIGIYDTAYWIKVKAGDAVGGLVRVPPTMIAPIGNWFTPAAYQLMGSRGRRELSADKVVHFFGYSPDKALEGVSPIETLRRLLAEEYAADVAREAMWRNGTRISGYIRRPLDAPEWGDRARERFKSGWQAQYTGDGPQTGGTPILEDGMEFTPAAFSAEQAQYLETRKLSREEVAAAYFIPPPMVGILDHASFSNIEEQHKMLYSDTLGPWLTMITEDLELQLLPDFPDSAGVYVEFNLAAKLAGSFEEQATSLQTAVGGPWLTRNEARARQNLPQIDGGDELIVPLNVLVGGQASPTDSAPPKASSAGRQAVQVKSRASQAQVDKAAAKLAKFFARQHRAIASKVGADKARGKAAVDEVYDAQRWDNELAADLFPIAESSATAAGKDTLEQAGIDPDTYDSDRTLPWLEAHASGVASGINGVTKVGVAQALGEDDPLGSLKSLFEVYATARAAQIALTEVTAASGFGTVEAAQQSGHDARKQWITGPKPRKSHQRMNGQTVAVGEKFSNGARWPGDSLLSDDERAGCNCDLSIILE